MSNTGTRKHSRSAGAKTSAKPRRAGPARSHEERPGAPVSVDSEAMGNTDAGLALGANRDAPTAPPGSGIPKGPSNRSIQLWPIEKLRPYERNPRMHSRDQVAEIAASIIEFGFVNPVLVATDAGIIAGHGRLLAARELGLTMVPVLVLDHLSKAQRRAYVIADNRLAERATWDKALLAEELRALYDEDFSLNVLGFSDEELEGFLGAGIHGIDGEVDPDSVPLPPDDPITKPGDLWILGEHRLLCGDSSKPEDVDQLLAGSPIHLVNTDPPYNVKVEPRSNNAIAAGLSSFGEQKMLRRQGAIDASDAHGMHHQGFDLARDKTKSTPTTRKMRAKDRPLENDFVSDEAFEEMLLAWFGNLARVLEPGRSFYIWGGYANLANYPPALKACGLYFSQSIIWDKQHPVLTRKDFMGAHEQAFYGWKEGAAHYFTPEIHNATDLWSIHKINPQSMVHLCLHPDALVLTESGYRPINSVAIGDRVYAADGRFHCVLDVSSHAYQSPELVRIVAKGGNVATLASDNHPFLIWRPERRGRSVIGGTVAWLRADEIRVGDYTMTPLLDEPVEDPFPERDEDYWFLFGLYVAQGSIQKAGHGRNHYPAFHLHKRRQDLVARIRNRWDSVSEYDPNDYGEQSQGVTVMAFDPDAGAAFEELGGRLSHAKRLAPEVFRLPRAKRLAVFQGWLNGDGCRVHDRTYWQGNTCSPDLATHLALLGESVGYKSHLFRYDPPVELGMINGRRIRSARAVYNLYFYARDPNPRRRKVLYGEHQGREHSLRYVKSVDRVPYSGEVWNLTVEGSHTFQTAVGLSHNTEKPVDLAVRAITYSSRPGENVLDLFGGSGSTMIGAEQTGRRSYLMEIDPAYCDVIAQRFAAFVGSTGQMKLIRDGKETPFELPEIQT